MATTHLALAHRSSPPAVFRYTNGTVVQIGGTFGTAEPDSDDAGAQLHSQRVCQFRGSNDLYALVDDDVYAYSVEDDDWSSVHTLAIPGAAKANRLGPIVMNVGNVPTMVVIYKTNNGSNTEWRFVTSVDGATWNESAGVTGGTATGATEMAFWKPMVFNQTVWVFQSDSGVELDYLGFNPTAVSIVSVDPTSVLGDHTASRMMLDHCVYNGRHYVCGSHEAVDDSSPAVYEFDGLGGFTLKFAGAAGAAGTLDGHIGKWCLFTDGTSMFGLFNWALSGQTRGWDAVKFVEAAGVLTPTNIQTTVIPSAIQQNNAIALTESFAAIVDPEEAPGTVPEIYLYRRSTGATGSAWSVYKWNGEATPIGDAGSPTDTGGDTGDALAFDKLGSGKVFNALDELDIRIESITQAVNGEILAFRVYAPGTRIDISGISGSFAVGDALTFAPSGAAAVVAGVGAAVLTIDVTSGTVAVADTATGPSGSATVDVITGIQGPETVNVEYFYNDEGETPQNQATLSNASAGTIVSNQIQGIDADARGSTLYTVKWEAATDGIGNGVRVVMTGRVSL